MKKFRTHKPLLFAFGVVCGSAAILAAQVTRGDYPMLRWNAGTIALIAALAVVGISSVVASFVACSVTLSTEGLEVRNIFGGQFVGYEHISYVKEYVERVGRYKDVGVAIMLTTGEELRVSALDGPGLTRAIRAAMGDFEDAREELEQAELDPQRLECRGRSPRQWLAELRELARPGGDYRRQRIAPKDLWQVVENRTAHPEQRAAAAMALTPLKRHRDRDRLRVASLDASNPKLRVALDVAAEWGHTDDDLAEALAETVETESG